MIYDSEIDEKSSELGVNTANVQRDYAFGWLLSSFYQPNNALSEHLVLKGGNCFRKAYFEFARYSSDLDFSTKSKVDAGFLLESIKQACAHANENSGIEFLIDESRVGEKRMVDGESRFFEARVYFKSFYGEDEDLRIRVSLDVKDFDNIFLPVQSRQIIHSYSDFALCRANIRCFKLEELLASKLKALLQRRHSPDLYDFVHSLFFQKSLAVSKREILSTFLKQTIYDGSPEAAKGLLLSLPFQLIKGFWNEYLVCPANSEIGFDDAESWFKSLVVEIFSLAEPRFNSGTHGAGSIYFSSDIRNTIMEGGRLKRLLILMYGGYERHVEPYALVFKRKSDGVGREYFYAYDRTGGSSGTTSIKTFTADKIESIAETQQEFEPRYPIELAKAGSFFGTGRFGSGRASPKPSSVARVRAQKKGLSATRAYVLQCPYCLKKFSRSSFDARLNKHTDRFGNSCYGRMGSFV